MSERCCEVMSIHLATTCDSDTHAPEDCPDIVIRELPDGCIGIPIHDGGSSYIVINYCPWCGRKL